MTSANQTLFIKLDYANCKPYPLPSDIPDPFSSGIPTPSPRVYLTPPSGIPYTLLLRYTYPFPSSIPYPSPQVYPTYPLRYTLPHSRQVYLTPYPQVHPTPSPKRDMGPVTRNELGTRDTLSPPEEIWNLSIKMSKALLSLTSL